MLIQIEVENCTDCPYFDKRYEFGEYTSYCSHEEAAKTGPEGIGSEAAYNHVGQDRLPSKGISYLCPFKKREANRWILVTDRLPVDRIRCEVIGKDEDGLIISTMNYEPVGKKFVSSGPYYPEVIAWRPVPSELDKENDDDE